MYNIKAFIGTIAKWLRHRSATPWLPVRIRLVPPIALVAQLDRASGYGPEGQGFDSSQARHITNVDRIKKHLLVFFFILFVKGFCNFLKLHHLLIKNIQIQHYFCFYYSTLSWMNLRIILHEGFGILFLFFCSIPN